MGIETAFVRIERTRQVLREISFSDLLALAALLGGGDAALLVRDGRGCWCLGVHQLSGTLGEEALRSLEGLGERIPLEFLQLWEDAPEIWLCIARKPVLPEGVEPILALCREKIRDALEMSSVEPIGLSGTRDRLRLRVQRLAESGEIAFFRWDGESRLLRGDHRFAAIFGISVSVAARGVPLSVVTKMIHHDDRAIFLDELQEGLRNVGRYEQRIRILSAGVEGAAPAVRHLLVRGWKENTSVDPVLRCSGLIIDVSAASVTEEALRSSEAFTRLLLSSSSDCFQVLDQDGTMRFISEGGVRALELNSPIILHGRPWIELWRGRGRKQAADALAQAYAGRMARFQGYADTMQGHRRFWDVCVTPIANEETGRIERILVTSRDMTQVNQAAERLQLALDAGAIAGTWMWDDTAGLVTGDSRLALTLGIDVIALEKGVSPDLIYDALDVRDREQVSDAINRTQAQGGPCRFEFRIPRDDGAHWFEASGYCDLMEDGGAFRFLGIISDIDVRKRQSLRQAALVELGDGLRSLHEPQDMAKLAARILCRELGKVWTGYADVSPDGNIASVLVDCCSAPGMHFIKGDHPLQDYQLILQRGQTVAISDVQKDPAASRGRDMLAGLGIRAVLNVPLFKFGRLVGVMMVHFGAPHVWSEEEIVFTHAMADRTHAAMRQARTQKQLRQLNELLEAKVVQRTRERDRLWSIASDLFAIIDSNGCYTSLSPSWQKGLGYRVDDLVGVSLDTLCHADDQSAVLDAFRSLEEGASSISLDIRMHHHDGSMRLYNWLYINESGECYAIGRDMTERAELEEQLRQSQKMEAVGQLTGGLAHDFNNLLAGIGGGLELLSVRIGQGRTTGLERYINAAQEAVQRAASLTHRLLAFSRRQTLDPRPTDVNDLIESLAGLLRGTAGPAINLVIDLETGPWLTRVDANQLENAVLNLCINARDAMPEGGRMWVRARNRTLGRAEAMEADLPAGDYVLVAVEDTGRGMTPDTAARAFDPFFTTKPIGQGTGLGLSMIYGFARQSGGHVRIASVPGEGTLVRMWLPRYVTATTDLEPPKVAASRTVRMDGVSLKGVHVLVVDDEAALRMVVRDVVEDLGGTVRSAESGPAALRMLEQDRNLQPDVLVTDIGMPGGLNGRQLAQRLRGRWPRLRILFITGYAEQGVLEDSVSEDHTAILVKPFGLEALGRKLAALMDDG
ncbi:PAS domain-containing protein [Gluconobacter wancherniae]|uniref:PAS domain-containing protein n=1 Tax=Gluconobacter wancherniae TaxID=1307955 RepID=UPI001B8BD8D3|nr:PAS domain-containing protein [Gluconobacter wancherniae]